MSIRWLPRPPRWRGWGFRSGSSARAVDEKNADNREWLEAAPSVLDRGNLWPSGCLIALAVGAFFVAAWFFVLPLLAFALDLFLVVGIAAAGVAARLLFRRPWIIEAEEPSRVGERREWLVVGRPAASRTIREVATALETGWPLDRISPTEAVRAS